MKNVIELKNVEKTFRYFKKDYMVFYWLFTKKGFTKEFKILKNISFSVKKGEIVGILGKNGAGKSTILKIISGIYFPTSGSVKVDGTIASLIELGAGFNKELTGRENIYFKGTLLGLSKEYIDENIESMLEFADIGEYVDMPLGTYSSGMAARLGFALAVNADPDILIIDEVFAVGDKNFQKKSRAKTEELLRSGKTVLFVSHSESLISEFCDRVLYLKEGDVVFDGDVKRGLAIYHADNLKLKREPILSFIESELNNNELTLRFEYGIGAGDQMVANDIFENFEFSMSRYDVGEKQATEYDIIDCQAEMISDESVDIIVQLPDVIDSGYLTVNFKHKNNDDYVISKFVEKQESIDYDNYILDIKNDNNNFAFQLNSCK
ncbi:ABC-type polysaccharide/polyol phosphate transport system ATPase subunit [Bacilli bacterium PM5-3]|nr:ABC-type polysaccharide/polyol phosphate transport system ATPase subunit [Bacilli bacterium PM5-3]